MSASVQAVTSFAVRGLLTVTLLCNCATAHLIGPRSFTPDDPQVMRTVVIEPLFEMADWQTEAKTELATISPMGSGLGMNAGPQTVAVTRTVTEKPFFARPLILVEIHRRLLAALQVLRPSWKLTSTSGASALSKEVTIVRTVIHGNELVASDRMLKNMAFGFGLVLLPLQILAAQPVEETQRVSGLLERYVTTAEMLKTHLIKYPTQPDYSVSLNEVQALQRQFALDVTYEEGLLADESPRATVLIDGFVERLAAAVVAIVEEPGVTP